MKPFVAGDILIGLTELNDPSDDHAGDGRIVQYSADLTKKGELWTDGGHHLIGGLTFGPDGLLWAFNDLFILHIDPKSGRQRPLSKNFKPRTYRSVNFAPDGGIWLGEQMLAKDPPPGIEKRTTIKFSRLPDTGWLGHGRIYKYDRDWNLVREFDVDHCPEPTGFKGVSHSTMHPGGRFITYIAETGKRIMRFDVVAERQMPDLVKYPGDDIRDGNWVTAVRYLPDGRLLASRSTTMDLIGEDGKILREYRLDDSRGWAAIALCRDGRHVLLANNWTGIFGRYDLENGEFIGTVDTGFKAPRRSLAGIAEFAG
jgi:hypothetical protein